VLLSGRVERGPRRPGARVGDASGRVDRYFVQGGGVDEQLVGSDRCAGTVPAGLHRHAQIPIGSPAHCLGDFLGAVRVSDHGGLLLGGGVVRGGGGAIWRTARPRQQVLVHVVHCLPRK